MAVRIGVVGLGMMGWQYCNLFKDREIPQGELTAVVSRSEEKRREAAEKYGVQTFARPEDMVAAGVVDGVILCTPHRSHPAEAIAAFAAGVHVLTEKPLAAEIGAAREMVAAWEKKPQVLFGIMFNQRTRPLYRAMRKLVRGGEIGEITRVTWIVSDWFRTNAYYGMSDWRATWAGEGGGVAINQCAHNLDILQWVTGLEAVRVRALAAGKAHPIEVDDEVSALIEYRNGAVGQFVTSTAEWPGTNRLEIHGTRGKVVAEEGKLRVWRVPQDTREIIREAAEAMPRPEVTCEEVTLEKPVKGLEHRLVIADFVAGIAGGKTSAELIAPGAEGLGSLEMSNAMLMAGFTGEVVGLPLEGKKYERFAARMVEKGGRVVGGKGT